MLKHRWIFLSHKSHQDCAATYQSLLANFCGNFVRKKLTSQFWSIFNECAKSSQEFDLLKVFESFLTAVISPAYFLESWSQYFDPEISFENLFGEIGRVAINVSNLVMKISKNITLTSFDEGVYKLTNLQSKPNFTSYDATYWLLK